MKSGTGCCSVRFGLVVLTVLASSAGSLRAAHPLSAPGVTSLTNPRVAYRASKSHHVVLTKGDVTAVIVDNAAVTGEALLAEHRAGYNGIAQLTHKIHWMKFAKLREKKIVNCTWTVQDFSML